MKSLTDFKKFRRWKAHTLDAFPCLKQTSIPLNQPLAKSRNHLLPVLFFSALFLITLFTFVPEEAFPRTRGGIVAVPINDTQGNQVILYKASYALIIGISDYTGGWPKLPGVKTDVKAVKETLEKIGFKVILVEDPNQRELEDAFKDFVLEYGLDPEYLMAELGLKCLDSVSKYYDADIHAIEKKISIS